MDQDPLPDEPDRSRLSELDLVYNPSLGAYLIWRASRGHFAEISAGLPIHLAFLVLPLMLHGQSRRVAMGTQSASGLTLFAAKLGAKQEDLLAVHQRALALRSLTLGSISAGVMTQLLGLDAETARIVAFDQKLPKPPPDIVKLGSACEKLGTWVARLPIEQVASTLRVAF